MRDSPTDNLIDAAVRWWAKTILEVDEHIDLRLLAKCLRSFLRDASSLDEPVTALVVHNRPRWPLSHILKHANITDLKFGHETHIIMEIDFIHKTISISSKKGVKNIIYPPHKTKSH